jgi:hypothetical protein
MEHKMMRLGADCDSGAGENSFFVAATVMKEAEQVS